MLKTLIVAGLVLLGLVALAPAAEATPPPCSASLGPESGYVACRVPGGPCVWVSYGGTFYCVPR